jgi:F-type H+-transporting ATPase subunit b
VQIDWFTLVAQLVNFLILLLLLRRFLYGPITRVMAERRERVAAQLSEAAAREAEADGVLADYEKKLEELERARKTALEDALAEAETIEQERIDEARVEVAEMRRRWQEALAREQATFLQELRQRVISEMYQTMRQLFEDMADEDLEPHLVRAFLKRLRSLDPSERDAFAAALRHAEGSLSVTSAFALADPQRRELEKVAQAVFGDKVTCHYQRSPDLICGIEVSAYDQKLAWNLDGYLAGLESAVEQQLAAGTPSEPEATAS